MTNLRIATTSMWKDKSGEKQEKTEWHSVVLYGREAEVAAEYLKKGRSVYIEGRLQTRKWQDKEGQDRYTTEVVGERMQMLGGRDGGGSTEGGEAKPRSAPPSGGEAKGSAAPKKKNVDDFDDDIPF